MSSSRTRFGKGRSASRSPCRWPSSRFPTRNSTPPKRCGWLVTPSQFETSSAIRLPAPIVDYNARYPWLMPTYQRLGRLPRKRHIQFRENGRLLTEEVMGLRGFVGNESILYHLQSPCRVKEVAEFEPIERDEWVPEGHAHRHFRTIGLPTAGDAVTG